jgi:hypothetical protein
MLSAGLDPILNARGSGFRVAPAFGPAHAGLNRLRKNAFFCHSEPFAVILSEAKSLS